MSKIESDRTTVVRSKYYKTDDNFCAECGTILPLPDMSVGVTTCPRCHVQWPAKEMKNELVWSYTETYRSGPETKASSSTADGPDVERTCSKCNNDRMVYSTRQTRSADEGMTVFFTCVSCGHKDIEYS